MRRIIATFLLSAFALLVTTFAGLSVFGMGHDAEVRMDDCTGTHCAAMPMGNSGANDVGCINDCLSSATALTGAILPLPLTFGFLAMLCALFLAELVTLTAPVTRRVHRWREGIGIAFRRQSLATVILRN
jgi:hypothetical protein